MGTEVTGTRVTLDAVHLDLTSGRGTLHGLVVANPPGFSGDYAFSLGKVVVGVKPASLAEPVIVITEVSIEGARLIAEQKGASTNLDQILKNVERATSDSREQKPGEKPDSGAADVRLTMQAFAFVDTEATVISELKGEGSLKVPDVRRSDIGDPASGLTPAQMANRLLQAVIEEVNEAVEDYLADLAKEAAMKKIQKKMGLSDDDVEAAKSGLEKLLGRD